MTQALADFAFSPLFYVILALAAVCIAAGVILSIRSGAIKTYSLSLKAIITILFIYIVAIVMFKEQSVSYILEALPFISDPLTFITGYSGAYTLLKTDFYAFLTELSDMFILAAIVGTLSLIVFHFLKHLKKNIFVWYITECIILVLAIGLKFAVDYALKFILPDGFAEFLPVLIFLLGILLVILYILKIIFKTVAFFAAPFFTLIFSFFGTTPVGRVIKIAFLASFALGFLAVALELFGLGAELAMLSASVLSVAPIILILLLLAYILIWFW